MAFLSVRAAAQLTGKSKSTILRAIQSGRLSATRAGNGAFGIDLVELCRVYPAAGPAAEVGCFTDPAAQKADPTNEPDAIVPEPTATVTFVETRIEQARDRCRTRAEHAALARSEAECRPWWVSAASNAAIFSGGILSIGLACRAKLLGFVSSLHLSRGSKVERRGVVL
jgi:excisionase family DNA binding protein